MGGQERTRFVGKHSKDQLLSLYIQKRNILEWESEALGSGIPAQVEPITGILRIRPSLAIRLEEKGQVVILGVFSRVVCDSGIHLTEHVVFQQEAQIYPQQNTINNSQNNCVRFDFDTKFVTVLPDKYHVPFIIHLPPGLPPSVSLVTGSKMVGSSATGESWGLTYYVFAYVTSASSVGSAIGRSPDGSTWHKLRLGRRQSKVFLSFAKANIPNLGRLHQPPSTGGNSRGGLISRNPLSLQASLDRGIYQYGDPIGITIQVANPRGSHVGGIRVTVKQVVTVRVGFDDQRTVIKTCIGRWDKFPGILDGPSQKQKSITNERIEVRPVTDSLQNRWPYQLALELRYPRSSMIAAPFAPSIFYHGPGRGGATDVGLNFGMDKVGLLAVEYYVNVHVIIPLGPNLIVKLPFKMVTMAGGTTIAASKSDDIPSDLVPISSGSLEKANMNNHDLARMTDAERRESAIRTLHGLRNGSINGNLISLDDDDEEDGHEVIDEIGLSRTSHSFTNRTPKLLTSGPSLSSVHGSSPALGFHKSSGGDLFLTRFSRLKLEGDLDEMIPASSLADDVSLAKKEMKNLNSQLSEEQRIIITCVGDVQPNGRNHGNLSRKLIEAVDLILHRLIPRFEQTFNREKPTTSATEFDPISAAVRKVSSPTSASFKEARELVIGTMSAAMIGSRLVQYDPTISSNSDALEGRLEGQVNGVVDLLELLLLRATQFDLSMANVLERFRHAVRAMIPGLLPAYGMILTGCRNLLETIQKCSDANWILLEHPYNQPIDAKNSVFDEEKDAVEMASLFEQLIKPFINTDEEEVPVLGANFIKILQRYLQLITAFFEHARPTDRAGLAAFWQWHFLTGLLDGFYGLDSEDTLARRYILAEVQGRPHVEGRRPLCCWRWSPKVLAQVPASWQAVSQATSLRIRLDYVGNQVIAVMSVL